MNVGFKKFMIVWFALGIVWAWAIVAVAIVITKFNEGYLVHDNFDMPQIINTVETIPVEVYKLEREDK